MEFLDLYKSMYYYELETKEKINSRINIPIGIATVLAGGAGVFLEKVIQLPDSTKKGICIIVFGIYILALFKIVIGIFKTYCMYEYSYVTAEMIREFQMEIIKYYDEYYDEYFLESGTSKDDLIAKDISEKLIERYVEATTKNMASNKKKLGYLRFIGLTTLVCLISGCLTYIILNNF